MLARARAPSALAVLAVVVLAGCVAAPADPPAAPPAPSGGFGDRVAAIAECPNLCYEPTVAVDLGGRIFVVADPTDGIAVSQDGGRTFAVVAAPPVPEGEPGDVVSGDALVQTDPAGRLYYSALLIATGGVGAPGLVGLHVAASDDAGATWASNVRISASTTPTTPATHTDRQWLVFAPGEVVYATYQSPGVGLFVTRSADGGRSFGPLSPVDAGLVISGAGVADEAGRLLLPYFHVGANALRVALSEDGGTTFARVDAYPAPDVLVGPGDFFPSLVLGGDGVLRLAWKDAPGRLLVAESADGAAWSAPADWSAGGAEIVTSPWALAGRGTLDVLAFERGEASGTSRLVLYRAPLASALDRASVARTVVAESVHGFEGREGNTDFAHGARLPDGRIVATWSDREEAAAWVSVEAAASSD